MEQSNLTPKTNPRSKFNRVMLLSLFLIGIMLVALPKDKSPLIGTATHETVLVTDGGIIGGINQYWSDVLDLGSSCEYRLLGWISDTDLYFESTCIRRGTQTWSYNVRTQTSLEALPPIMLEYTPVPDEQILNMTKVNFKNSTIFFPQEIFLVDDSGIMSSKGNLIAMITQWTYGQQDVVIVAQKSN